MLKFIEKIIKLTTYNKTNITDRLLLLRASRPAFVFKKYFKMAGVSSKMKSDLNLEENPTKKIKLTLNEVATRTVATMCGAWRPEEEDGGMVLVLPTRKPCLSPDPEKESDFPENVEDFWDAALYCSGDDQIYYLDFEHPNFTYFNPKYYEYANITAQRYNRRDIIHYVNIHFKSYTVLGNDVKVDASVYEFLSNEYRRSMVEMHFGLCETFVATKYHMFMPFYAKYFNASSCPFPMGEYHFMNMSIPNVPLLATFPFRKGLVCGSHA